MKYPWTGYVVVPAAFIYTLVQIGGLPKSFWYMLCAWLFVGFCCFLEDSIHHNP